MKAIIIQDSDSANLLDLLKLENFEMAKRHPEIQHTVVSDIHRRFHYIVCRWLQEQGANVIR